MKQIAILGSTGSIGQNTLSIIQKYPERFRVASLAAGHNIDAAFEQCVQWRPQVVSVATEELADSLSQRLKAAGVTGVEVVHGTAGTVRVATLPEADFVVSAIVGVAGLEATYAAVRAGKPVGLANKEAMVAAGEILNAAAREKNVPLLPIDSEQGKANAWHTDVTFIDRIPAISVLRAITTPSSACSRIKGACAMSLSSSRKGQGHCPWPSHIHRVRRVTSATGARRNGRDHRHRRAVGGRLQRLPQPAVLPARRPERHRPAQPRHVPH